MTESTKEVLRRGNLFVADEKLDVSSDGNSAVVTIGCDNPQHNLAIEELQSTDARHLATAYAAQQGMGDPRINGNLIGPYPINHAGKPLDQMTDDQGQPLPPTHQDMQVAAYRVGVPVCRKPM